MSRTKGGTVAHSRHKKIIKQAKGYYGRRKSNFKVATQAVDRLTSTQRVTGRTASGFPRVWIQRINAAACP